MNVLVTGATGFLGKAVVEALAARGHKVRAIARPASRTVPPSWANNPHIEIVRGDLRIAQSISAMLDGIDTVVHLAAVKCGDLFEQFAGTVGATENLLNGMIAKGISRCVLCSTFSVYECLNKWNWSLLDEESPLVKEPQYRDEYSQTKLVQEALVRDTAKKHGWSCIVLRPGVIYGPDNLWSAWLGEQLNERWWIRTGTFAFIPLTYVENCAEAFARAVEYSGNVRELILNVVDDETPTQRSFLNAVHAATKSRARVIPIPWLLLRFTARILWTINTLFWGGKGKLPGMYRPAALHARCKPLRYSNRKLRATLGWAPRFDLREGLARSLHPVKS